MKRETVIWENDTMSYAHVGAGDNVVYFESGDYRAGVNGPIIVINNGYASSFTFDGSVFLTPGDKWKLILRADNTLRLELHLQ